MVLVHFLTNRVGTGDPPQTAYRHRVFYVGTDVRDLAGPTRMVEYLPLSLADVPRLFENGRLPLDVAMVQVAPPDHCRGQPRHASHLRRQPDPGR